MNDIVIGSITGYDFEKINSSLSSEETFKLIAYGFNDYISSPDITWEFLPGMNASLPVIGPQQFPLLAGKKWSFNFGFTGGEELKPFKPFVIKIEVPDLQSFPERSEQNKELIEDTNGNYYVYPKDNPINIIVTEYIDIGSTKIPIKNNCCQSLYTEGHNG